jgi:serine protease AprX
MGKLENITRSRKVNKITSAILGSTMAFTAAAWGLSNFSNGEEYILQGASRPALVSAIQAENGVIIHQFKLIQAVSAKLTDEQVLGIASRNAMIRFFNEDNQLSLSAAKDAGLMESRVISKSAPRNSQIPKQVGAHELHKEGITGKGVTVAIIDSGLGQFAALQQNTYGQERNITVVDASGEDAAASEDLNGHGSHVASILADSSSIFDQFGAPTGAHSGVAPDVDLVMIKAFDEQGKASYSSVLKGIEYAINNKDSLNIRVLNVAFSFPATSFYWEDPINQALMRAWDNGITVIAPAGNGNNKDMSIGVPGNNPYVITVGAMDDNSTPFDTSDDVVASFSSFGPTLEGFMKPEVLAPGANVKGLVAKNSRLADKNKKSGISGTSQATAVTAGVVALMIQQDPSLTPDEIKCRLMSSASLATKQNGELAFSRYAQGAGLINATAAINATIVGCANNGLDIYSDINLRSQDFGTARSFSGEIEVPDGVVWHNDRVKSGDETVNGVVWHNDKVKSGDETVNGVVWHNDRVKSGDETVNGVVWHNDRVKSGDETVNGVVWHNDSVKSGDETANGVVWHNDSVKSGDETANGVVWHNDRVKSGDETVNGVVWHNDSVKSGDETVNGVVWHNDSVKSGDETVNGVVWHNDRVKSGDETVNGVVWHNDRVKSGDETANGVVWHNDRVKSGDETVNGVVWHNDRVKSGDETANGVVWHNDRVKSGDETANGVVWHNDRVKSGDETANGVVWHNDKVKPTDRIEREMLSRK